MVEIAASVRADELRFECKPDVRVGAWANAPATAESSSERDNLPDELQLTARRGQRQEAFA